MKQSNASVIVVKETIVIEEKSKIFSKGYWKGSHYISKGSTGHWSKWGGARMDLVQENVSDTWNCQSCGLIQPKDLTPYRFEFLKGEYIRVCALCLADGCIILKQRAGVDEG